MRLTTPFRVPLFLECDVESDGLEHSEGDALGQVTVRMRVPRGRIVTEDGTILAEIAFDVPDDGD